MFGSTSTPNTSALAGAALLCRKKSYDDVNQEFDWFPFSLAIPLYFLLADKDNSRSVRIFLAVLSVIAYPLQLACMGVILALLLILISPCLFLIWFCIFY